MHAACQRFRKSLSGAVPAEDQPAVELALAYPRVGEIAQLSMQHYNAETFVLGVGCAQPDRCRTGDRRLPT